MLVSVDWVSARQTISVRFKPEWSHKSIKSGIKSDWSRVSSRQHIHLAITGSLALQAISVRHMCPHTHSHRSGQVCGTGLISYDITNSDSATQSRGIQTLIGCKRPQRVHNCTGLLLSSNSFITLSYCCKILIVGVGCYFRHYAHNFNTCPLTWKVKFPPLAMAWDVTWSIKFLIYTLQVVIDCEKTDVLSIDVMS